MAAASAAGVPDDVTSIDVAAAAPGAVGVQVVVVVGCFSLSRMIHGVR